MESSVAAAIWITLCLGGACYASSAEASQPAMAPMEPERGGVDPKLELVLQVPREVVQLGEPVALVVSLVNRGGAVVEVDNLLELEYGFLDVQVTRPDGSTTALRPAVRAESGRGYRPEPLGPGETFSTLVPLYYAREGWFLREPGRYSVRMRYVPSKQAYESEPASFEVRKPESAMDRKAAALFMDGEAARFFYLEGGSAEGQRALEEIVETHAESHVAGYASLALGQLWSRAHIDPGTKNRRGPDYERATSYLQRALERLRDPAYGVEASIELARCYVALDRLDDARSVREKMLERFDAFRQVGAYQREFAAPVEDWPTRD